jgi:hypothetical protein
MDNPQGKKSPFIKFLKFIVCAGLVFVAYIIGDSAGYKRGFQETVGFTTGKLGIDATVNDYDEYSLVLDTYLEESQNLDRSIENILSPNKLGGVVGDLVTDFLEGLFGN